MQYEEGRLGRVFALRLEEGDRLPDCIEEFAGEKEIRCGMVIHLGGVEDGSRLVVGPEANRGEAIVSMIHVLRGIQEILALGTLFPNESGKPTLHLHAAVGREGNAVVGCTRAGVGVWLVGEVILLEILGMEGLRKKDLRSGYELLQLKTIAG